MRLRLKTLLPLGPHRSLRWLPLSLLACIGVLHAPSAGGIGGDGASTPPAWPPSDPVVVRDEERFPTPSSVRVAPRQDGRWDVTFLLSLDTAPKSVVVAGSFNGWSREAAPMRRGADGVWTARVALAPGTWEYKFVLDGDRWLQDPKNDASVDDRNGGRNSLLKVGALANLVTGAAKPGDGAINASALGHEPARTTFRQRARDGAVILRYRTLVSDVEGVVLLRRDAAPYAMRPVLANSTFQYWEAGPLALSADTEYTFRVLDGATVVRDPELYRLESTDVGPRTPDWAKHAIWYQIFPERFRNGRSSNDQPGALPWTSDWYEMTPSERERSSDFYEVVFDRRYGGDLQGIREKLPYLKELGVTALYLTPIFQSPSLHRYDATSYIHVDEHLGVKGDYAPAEAKEDLLDPSTWIWTESDKEFLSLLKEAKSMGFRVIIDGVFNHVGLLFPAYLDVKKNGKESRFADWFSVKSWDPFEVEGWAGFPSMPVFKKSETGLASDAVVQHIFAITKRWMDPNGDGDPSDGIDGWRLDVPNEVPLGFWRDWRRLVKSINPDAYLVGEIWRRAEEWVDGTVFDAVMNYPFADAVIAWVGNREKRIGASELDRQLAELRMAYAPEATYVLQNLLDSHDTDRVASMMANPDRDYNAENRPQSGAVNYITTKPPAWAYEKVRLLSLIQMTYVGAPMVWYGDEVGMYGASDPTNRKPMLWPDLEPFAKPEDNTADQHQLAWYRDVIALRRGLVSLRIGDFKTLLTDDVQQVWVFERVTAEERVIVALNAGEDLATVRLPVEGQWVEVFASNGQPRVDLVGRSAGDRFPKVTLPAIGGRVWRSVAP